MTVRPLVYQHVSGRNTQGTILDHQGTFQVLNREIVLCLLEFQNGLHRQTEPWMRHVQESQDKGKIMRMSWLQGFGVMHIVTCWQNVAHRTN